MFLHPVDCLAGRARMRAQRHASWGMAEFTTLMQVIVLPLAYRCRQRLSRWLYQRWPALAGKGRSALSPAQPLPARKAKILLAVLYIPNISIYILICLSIECVIKISHFCWIWIVHLKYDCMRNRYAIPWCHAWFNKDNWRLNPRSSIHRY